MQLLQIFIFLILSLSICFRESESIESFVIVFQGSQGSSFLIEMLAQLQDICIIGYEPLGEANSDRSTNLLKKFLYPGNSSFEQYKSAISGLIDSREHFDKCNGKETIYGIKARLSPFRLNSIMKSPAFSKTKFIVLERNMVKQAVGTYRRKNCGLGQFELRVKIEQKKSQDEINNFKNKKCNVQLAPLRSLCLHYWKHRDASKEVLRRKDRVMSISYEEIMLNVSYVIDRKIAPFLSARSARKVRRPPSLQKASPDLLCRSVENFGAVCEMVKMDLPPAFRQWMNADSCTKAGSDADGHVGGDCCPEC
jgi:hypothetical protein